MTSNRTELDVCDITQAVVWPVNCSSSFISMYKTSSLILGCLFYVSLIAHGHNLVISLYEVKFNVIKGGPVVRNNMILLLAAFFGMLFESNRNGIHHDDGCAAYISIDLCTSLMLTYS